MELDTALLVGAVVLIAAVLSARLGSRLGVPSLLLFLGLGLALQPFGIVMTDADLAHQLGFAALVLILAEGGLTTRWADIRSSLRLSVLLASVGVIVSIVLVAGFAHLVLGAPLPIAVLIGAITAPTDAAAVFAVLRGLPLPARVRSVLEGESGLNDAPVVLLVAMATSWAMGSLPEGGLPVIIGTIVGELAGGLLLGAAVGYLAGRLLPRLALPASGLYPLATVGVLILSYGLGVVLHVSGFAAVYVAALVVGNSDLPHRNATRSFGEGVGWVAQIGLFVMLGMLANPELITWWMLLEALLIGTFLTFVARPLTVMACAVWFRVPWREQAFISWAGLRGAIPIIMATVPLAAGLSDAPTISEEVLVIVVIFSILQAPTLPWVARRLGISDEVPSADIEVEVAPLDRIRADFMQVRVPAGSRLHGVTIKELHLPQFAVVGVIVRGGEPLVPGEYDRLVEGDEMLIVVPSARRHEVEERFRAMGKGGRLASWYDDDDGTTAP